MNYVKQSEHKLTDQNKKKSTIKKIGHVISHWKIIFPQQLGIQLLVALF